MSQITTHVLDTALGLPAAGIPVLLESRVERAWAEIASGETDGDGRVGSLGPDALAPGHYRITFQTSSYHGSTGRSSFFPEVTVLFVVDGLEHYHVPLLLSPFGYSTYRGS